MKIQYALPIALLAWSPALRVNANDRVEALTRKRDAPLPAGALLNANKDNHQEVELSEQEELFLRYLQEATSHGDSMSMPTAAPTGVTGKNPTKAPSKAPVKAPSAAPSAAPTKAPTRLPTVGTRAPTRLPTVGGSCKDSGTKFLLTTDQGVRKKRSCNWVGKNNSDKRCGYKNVASHCPDTCNQCAAYKCADSARKFVKWGKNDKPKSCDWVKRKPNKLAHRCDMKGFRATCRASCNYVGNGLSC